MARAVVVGLGFGVMFAAVDDVALVFLAREELGVGALGHGVLSSSSYGEGMVVTALVLMRGRTRAAGQIFVLGWLLTGLGGLATAPRPRVCRGPGRPDRRRVRQWSRQRRRRHAGSAHRSAPANGAGLGVVTAAGLFGGATARGLGGVVLDLTSARTTFVIGGVGVLVATAVTGVMLARAGWGSEPD